MKRIVYGIAKGVYRLLPKAVKIKIRKKREEKNYKNPITKEGFIEEISAYDIISFDIFDTLLTRKIYNPDDLFRMMDEKLRKEYTLPEAFLSMRKKAEQEANVSLNKEANIDDIYLIMQKMYTLPKTMVTVLKKLEIELELALCIPRIEMLEVFEKLKKMQKRIILVSDMYLTKEVIVRILKSCGYEGYEELYVSNDLNLRKDNKQIWPYIQSIYPDLKMVHIGDNLNSDYLFPQEFGIHTIKIESGREMSMKTDLYLYLADSFSSSISNSLQYGLLFNKCLYNSPFASYYIDTLDKLSYTAIAPLLYPFINDVATKYPKKTLLFLAREGYYLQQLYQNYCRLNNIKESPNFYFLASRRATQNCLLDDKDIISAITEKEYKGSLKKFLIKEFGIIYKEPDRIVELPKEKDLLVVIAEQYRKEIGTYASKNKKNYLKYIKYNLGKTSPKELVTVDLGYAGTIQYNLSKILNSDLIGCYLSNRPNIKTYQETSVLDFTYDANQNSKYGKIYDYSLILEYFLSAPFGQLLNFDKDANPIYNDELLSKSKEKLLNDIYKVILEYFIDMKQLKDFYEYKSDLALLVNHYTVIVESNLIAIPVKDLFLFTDEYNNNHTYNVFDRISRY